MSKSPVKSRNEFNEGNGSSEENIDIGAIWDRDNAVQKAREDVKRKRPLVAFSSSWNKTNTSEGRPAMDNLLVAVPEMNVNNRAVAELETARNKAFPNSKTNPTVKKARPSANRKTELVDAPKKATAGDVDETFEGESAARRSKINTRKRAAYRVKAAALKKLKANPEPAVEELATKSPQPQNLREGLWVRSSGKKPPAYGNTRVVTKVINKSILEDYITPEAEDLQIRIEGNTLPPGKVEKKRKEQATTKELAEIYAWHGPNFTNDTMDDIDLSSNKFPIAARNEDMCLSLAHLNPRYMCEMYDPEKTAGCTNEMLDFFGDMPVMGKDEYGNARHFCDFLGSIQGRQEKRTFIRGNRARDGSTLMRRNRVRFDDIIKEWCREGLVDALIEPNIDSIDFANCIQEIGNTEEQNTLMVLLRLCLIAWAYEKQTQMYFTSVGETREIKKGFFREFLKSCGSPMQTAREGRNKDIMWLKWRALHQTEPESPYFMSLQRTERRFITLTRAGVRLVYMAPQRYRSSPDYPLIGYSAMDIMDEFNPVCYADLDLNIPESSPYIRGEDNKMHAFFKAQITLADTATAGRLVKARDVFNTVTRFAYNHLDEFALTNKERIGQGGERIHRCLKPTAIYRFFVMEAAAKLGKRFNTRLNAFKTYFGEYDIARGLQREEYEPEDVDDLFFEQELDGPRDFEDFSSPASDSDASSRVGSDSSKDNSNFKKFDKTMKELRQSTDVAEVPSESDEENPPPRNKLKSWNSETKAKMSSAAETRKLADVEYARNLADVANSAENVEFMRKIGENRFKAWLATGNFRDPKAVVRDWDVHKYDPQIGDGYGPEDEIDYSYFTAEQRSALRRLNFARFLVANDLKDRKQLRRKYYIERNRVVEYWLSNNKFWTTRKDPRESMNKYIRLHTEGSDIPFPYVCNDEMQADGVKPYNGNKYIWLQDHKKRESAERAAAKAGVDYYSEDSDDEGFNRTNFKGCDAREFDGDGWSEDRRWYLRMLFSGSKYVGRPDIKFLNWQLRPHGCGRRVGVDTRGIADLNTLAYEAAEAELDDDVEPEVTSARLRSYPKTPAVKPTFERVIPKTAASSPTVETDVRRVENTPKLVSTPGLLSKMLHENKAEQDEKASGRRSPAAVTWDEDDSTLESTSNLDAIFKGDYTGIQGMIEREQVQPTTLTKPKIGRSPAEILARAKAGNLKVINNNAMKKKLFDPTMLVLEQSEMRKLLLEFAEHVSQQENTCSEPAFDLRPLFVSDLDVTKLNILLRGKMPTMLPNEWLGCSGTQFVVLVKECFYPVTAHLDAQSPEQFVKIIQKELGCVFLTIAWEKKFQKWNTFWIHKIWAFDEKYGRILRSVPGLTKKLLMWLICMLNTNKDDKGFTVNRWNQATMDKLAQYCITEEHAEKFGDDGGDNRLTEWTGEINLWIQAKFLLYDNYLSNKKGDDKESIIWKDEKSGNHQYDAPVNDTELTAVKKYIADSCGEKKLGKKTHSEHVTGEESVNFVSQPAAKRPRMQQNQQPNSNSNPSAQKPAIEPLPIINQNKADTQCNGCGNLHAAVFTYKTCPLDKHPEFAQRDNPWPDGTQGLHWNKDSKGGEVTISKANLELLARAQSTCRKLRQKLKKEKSGGGGASQNQGGGTKEWWGW